MPPSTFASAAAGSSQNQNSTRDGSDWSRRPNGATQTFRRQSNATTTSASNPPTDATANAPAQPPRYVPPHRNGMLADTRYSKGQLLDLFRTQNETDGSLKDGLQTLFVSGWQPEAANGASATGWGRSDHSRDPQPGPDVCWDRDGLVEPLGLVDLDDEEKELFFTSVNTPLKPPTNQSKENQQLNGLQGRKLSVTQGITSPGGFGLPSPTATRAGLRRRETSESYPFSNPLASPAGTSGREEQRAASPPPSLTRRKTDFKDAGKVEDSEDKATASPFGTLKRNPTGPMSAGLAAPTSPWSTTPQSATFSPMGSFGNFGLGAGAGQQPSQSEKRPALGSGRAESRFKSLLQKDSTEDVAGKSIEHKTSMSSLSKVSETDSWRPNDRQDFANAPLDEADEDSPLPSGSAALTAGSDLSPSQFRHGNRTFDTPTRSNPKDEHGFAAFGMTADHAPGFGYSSLQAKDGSQQTPGQQRPDLPMPSGHEPMSPTNTNPYQSPEQHNLQNLHDDMDRDDYDMHTSHLQGLGGFGQDQGQQHLGLGGLAGFANLGRVPGPQDPASDRSQTSSTGPNRGFPGLGALGQIGGMPGATAGWPVSQGPLGTPSRQTAGLTSAFGQGIFSTSSADLASPSLAGLGGTGMLSPQGGNAFSSSRMTSMFPQGMQDQILGNDDRDQAHDRSAQNPFGGLGATIGQRDAKFPGQGFNDPRRTQPEGEQKALESQQQPPGQQQSAIGQPSHDQQQSGSSNQPPAPQQRTMVMPDRMRWIYKDPQGQTQGPWSGLEMHDWYRAGFFSPELLVKKAEDVDYEPLAQLIRRIGNSREPFLVPQIGIPHGAPSTQGPWAGTLPGATTGGAQPPFASSFPSFGTTLTAEQQNALERRKQEEQYLMARQKEHLAQAQIAQRVQHLGPAPSGLPPSHISGPLHHHSSAQSLHSQPSFGSMGSPSAYQPSPVQGPTGHGSGPYDGSLRGAQSGGLGSVGAGVENLGHISEEEIPNIMDRLNLSGRGNQFGAPGQPFLNQQTQSSGQDQHSQNVQRMLHDRAVLQQEQAQYDAASEDESTTSVPSDRFREFQQFQGHAALDPRFAGGLGSFADQVSGRNAQADRSQQEPLSLTEQVQKAASAKQSPVIAPQAWAKSEGGLPPPFPPAPSQSPLPAPAAQRTGRQSVADQLHVETSRTHTPSTETPNTAIAPWANTPIELQKGPSLREIQEMEAKKAAEAEEIAAAARRALLQKEIEAQALAATVAPAQPGLPSSANWAANNVASPASSQVGAAGSPWAKAAQPKPGLVHTKSMAQIQKEEEARKKKLATAQAQATATAMAAVANPAGGKSYANLAGKVSVPMPPINATGAWTTVGAGGKSKTPATPTAPPTNRTVSSGTVPTAAQPPTLRKPPTRSSTMNTPGAVNAQDEFRKWATSELRPDLNSGISADEFVSTLIFLPSDLDIITEAVHGSSNTIDSRHFAEEFIRRKKLADKGLIDASAPPKSVSPHNAGNGGAGGWSEVAKKGPVKEAAKEEGNGNFRVVAAKKKGGKR